MSLSSRHNFAPVSAATTLALVAPHGLSHFAYTSLVILETEHPECRVAVAAEIQRRRTELESKLFYAQCTRGVDVVRTREAFARKQGAGWHIVTIDGSEADYDSNGAAAIALVAYS
jgi:hypothetical protein